MRQHRPLALVILDGFGYRENPDANAIAAAHKPNWDQLWQDNPHTLVSGSGRCVGLPDGQMGNSEVGHLNMGAGRIVRQDLSRIDAAIEDEIFFSNEVLLRALRLAGKKTLDPSLKHAGMTAENAKVTVENPLPVTIENAVHIMGLLSPGGVHSQEQHIHAMLKMAAQQQVAKVYLHLFLDGRDTPPRSAMPSIQALDALCHQLQCGQIASIIGRYYAMDRDKRWERVEKAYDLLTLAEAPFTAQSAASGLELAYAREESDEFVQATRIVGPDNKPIMINDDDVVIFMNFRADRAREITQAFIDNHFDGFVRKKTPKLAGFVCLSEYDVRFNTPVAFPSQSLQNLFAEIISRVGMKQLRIAETEKYAHVTFFFNGGVETPFPHEDRILIPSPKVATYDLKPEMSAYELTDRLVSEIEKNQYDVIICNFANPDMVGHSGNFDATVKAIEAIDHCLGRIEKALKKAGGELIITADHGNAEQMFDYQTKQAHTAHTTDPVPFVYAGRPAKIVKENCKLSDIAPTMLYLLGLPQPPEMSGTPIISLL